MHVAIVYGRLSSGGPAVFDPENLYFRANKGLTGSESFCFNTARGLAELGHRVDVFADFDHEVPQCKALNGANAIKFDGAHRFEDRHDVALAWNEPDLLRTFPPEILRVCVQQLNDWHYCAQGFDNFVDLYSFPSEKHRQYMTAEGQLNPAKTCVVPNSLNLEFYDGIEERRPHSVAYCSSPDRGLHWLLEYWPHIRKRIPDAELRVYYTVDRWLESVRELWWDQGYNIPYEIGFRARYVEECLKRLGRKGENGVTVVGPVSNQEMARELMKTEVLAYPCDTVRWTEGFSVSIMDACAAGCVPLISDVDAIGGVYGEVAHVVPGRPQSRDQRWIDTIVRALTDVEFQVSVRSRTLTFAQRQTRQDRALLWEDILHRALSARGRKAA